jgi:ATP-dependent DNA helicase RecQ
VLRGEQRIEMRLGIRGKPTKGGRKRTASPGLRGVSDDSLLARLREWRREEARSQGVPAYVILHDSTLAAIAQRAPRSVESLAEIAGIGQKRLERYGAALIALLEGRSGAADEK